MSLIHVSRTSFKYCAFYEQALVIYTVMQLSVHLQEMYLLYTRMDKSFCDKYSRGPLNTPVKLKEIECRTFQLKSILLCVLFLYFMLIAFNTWTVLFILLTRRKKNFYAGYFGRMKGQLLRTIAFRWRVPIKKIP